MQLQQQRFDLVVAEQKEMGRFMTNVQRIRFEALQENFRRQIAQNFGPGGDAPPAGRRGRPPQ
jgi:hypothetical protein